MCPLCGGSADLGEYHCILLLKAGSRFRSLSSESLGFSKKKMAKQRASSIYKMLLYTKKVAWQQDFFVAGK